MSKFKWLITNALLRHGNVPKNRKFPFFYLFIARTAPNSSPGLLSSSIHSPPMTCLRLRLSIASLAGTVLSYDVGLLFTSEEDSEAVFENYWSPISDSSVGSACSLVSPQVFLRRGIPAHFLLLPRYRRLRKRS